MRLPLLVCSCLCLLLPLGACDTDPRSAAGAAGSLKKPRQPRSTTEVKTARDGREPDQGQMRPAEPAAGLKVDGHMKIGGVDGEPADDAADDAVLSTKKREPAKAGSYFLKIDGVDGEATDAKH
jgi:hypothetical protein